MVAWLGSVLSKVFASRQQLVTWLKRGGLRRRMPLRLAKSGKLKSDEVAKERCF